MSFLKAKYKPFETKSHPLGGVQKIYKFDNGFGASIVQNNYSYGGKEGLWELAVLELFEDGTNTFRNDTSVADDVVGYLTEDDVEEYLKKIENLDPL